MAFSFLGGAMVGDEPKVEIGLREVYDKVIEGNTSIQLFNQRITAMESSLRWLWRTLGGALIAAATFALYNHK